METNALYYGDNLVWLRDRQYFPDESVDLIYLDPPFNSKADYNLLFNEPGKGVKSQAQIKAFDDTWDWSSEASEIALNELAKKRPQIAEFISWLSKQGKTQESMAAYLSMMAIRLMELHRVLKSSGSLYLHCDPTASHYLKLLMDSVFGNNNFRNEIVWRRTGTHGKSRRYAPVHDIVLFYTKSDSFTWTYFTKPYMKKHVEEYFIQDEHGWRTNYYGNVLTGSGLRKGESGQPWHGFDPTAKGRHWAIPGKILEGIEEDFSGLTQHEKLDRLFELGYIRIAEGQAWPIYERYLTPSDGQNISDIWAYQPYTEGTVFGTDKGIDEDIRWLSPRDQERLGYQTQKPKALLERIIKASSNEGDTVLDPFCGCGTTVDAAQNLNRRWLGIDVTWLAIDKVEKRLKDTYGAKISSTYEVKGKPYDVASAQALANKSKKEFEIWAISLVGAHPREHDGGVDGIFGFVEKDKKPRTIIVQVKGGDVLNPGMVRDLIGTVKKEGAAIGLLITLKEPSGGMKSLAVHSEPYQSELWAREYPSIQIRTVAELLEGKTFDLPRSTQSPFKKAQLAKEDAEQIELDT